MLVSLLLHEGLSKLGHGSRVPHEDKKTSFSSAQAETGMGTPISNGIPGMDCIR